MNNISIMAGAVLWTALCSTLKLTAQQDTVAVRFARTITEGDLRAHLSILASDEFEGRETGRPGQKRAAEYLKQQFGSFGTPPLPSGSKGVTDGYYQPFDLVIERLGALSLKEAEQEFRFKEDLLYFRESIKKSVEFDTLVYCSATELGGLAPGTRAAVVLFPPPKDTGPGEPGLDGLDQLAGLANTKELELLLVCTDRFAEAQKTFAHWLDSERMRLASDSSTSTPEKRTQLMIISQQVAEAVLQNGGLSFSKEWKRAQKGRHVTGRNLPSGLSVVVQALPERAQSENVLAYIEGSDRKDEVVVITAHYDHIGVTDGEVYNGADDDGSGTVALLEIAQAFAQAKAEGHGPRRSVLLMPVAGEEKGLLGSRYYSEHPVFPLENTVADLNIDMIGRTDSAHRNSAPYVYIIGSNRLSTELHLINQHANEEYVGLSLDETFNAKDDPNRFYFRSDHYNFARKGIPVIFYFSGVHEDYHGPGDEVEKIQFDLLQRRALLVFHTAWILANLDHRPVVDGPVEE